MDTILFVGIFVALCVIIFQLSRANKIFKEWRDDWLWVNWDTDTTLKMRQEMDVLGNGKARYKSMLEVLDEIKGK